MNAYDYTVIENDLWNKLMAAAKAAIDAADDIREDPAILALKTVIADAEKYSENAGDWAANRDARREP